MTQTAKYAPGGRRDARPGRNRRPRASNRLAPDRVRNAPGRVRLGPGRTGLLGALVLAVLLLTGCVTVQLDATVHPDGTLSGTARYGVAKSLAAFSGGQGQLLDELKQSRSCDFGAHQGTTKEFDDGTYIGITCSFDHITMAEFNSDQDGPKLTKDGDEFHLTGRMSLLDLMAGSNSGLGSGGPIPSGLPTDLSSLLPSDFPSDLSSLLPSLGPTQGLSLPAGSAFPGLDPSTVLKTAKVSFAFTFPGKVKSSQGKIDGRKVTFKPDSSGNIDFQTTASAIPDGSSGPGTAAWWVLAAVLLALLAAAGLLVRRRRAAHRLAPTAGYPGGYPPGYPDAQGYPGAHGYPAGPQYPTQGYSAPPPYQPYQPTQEYPTVPPYPPSQPYPQGEPYPQGGPYPPSQPYPQGGPYPPSQPYPQGGPYPPDGPYPPSQPYPQGEPDQPSPWSAPAEQRSPWARPDAQPDAPPDARPDAPPDARPDAPPDANPTQPRAWPENDSGKS